jgi:hypothetical protein
LKPFVNHLPPTVTKTRKRHMKDEGVVSLEDIIAAEQIAEELWRKATGGTNTAWRALPESVKASWRAQAMADITTWRRSVGDP